jgi:hypothetical protein
MSLMSSSGSSTRYLQGHRKHLRRKFSTISLPVEMGPRERAPRPGSYAGIPCPGVTARMAVEHGGERVKGRERVRRARVQGKAQEQLLQGKE